MAWKPWLAIFLGSLCACAGQAASRPTRIADRRELVKEVGQAAATDKTGEQRGAETAETTEPQRALEEVRRCPDPYGDEGTAWVPKAWPNEETVRAMNARHGLLCTERPAEAKQLTNGVSQVWGCVNKNGSAVVPFVYSWIGDEAFYFAVSGLALVFKPGEGWLYIDVANRKLGRAETIDNRPDEAFGGYARFRAHNGKIGYLDHDRRVAIPARYAAAFPFASCTAQVCVGCHPDRWMKDAVADAECTGEAFIIDQSGKRLTDRLPADAAYCATRTAPATQK